LVITDREYLQAFLAFEVLPAGTYIALEVSDTGMGMDTETQARIFEPFFTTKFTGRGLGLAAVQGIIRGHKGAIRVYSQVGRGTSIRVLFPVGAADGPTLPATREVAPTGAGRLVLVIDDDSGVRAFAQRVLERGGYRVVTANDGREGVTQFAQQPEAFAAVLLDLTMPLMSGLETFAALRQLRSAVPVLLCSGYSEEEATASFAGKGLAGFVQKPFQVQAILTALHQVIV
jgi:CheY-like chemotaxis protein